MCVCVCVCVCMYMYIYKYIYIYVYIHIYIYIKYKIHPPANKTQIQKCESGLHNFWTPKRDSSTFNNYKFKQGTTTTLSNYSEQLKTQLDFSLTQPDK